MTWHMMFPVMDRDSAMLTGPSKGLLTCWPYVIPLLHIPLAPPQSPVSVEPTPCASWSISSCELACHSHDHRSRTLSQHRHTISSTWSLQPLFPCQPSRAGLQTIPSVVQNRSTPPQRLANAEPLPLNSPHQPTRLLVCASLQSSCQEIKDTQHSHMAHELPPCHVQEPHQLPTRIVAG